MKLAISNIAWAPEQDELLYTRMAEQGFSGLEIAPTRIFPQEPYTRIKEAAQWAQRLEESYGLKVCSMQSIWYGRSERVFGSPQERQSLLEYTFAAIDFAAAIGCGNLVFGCPRNRAVDPAWSREQILETAIPFFKALGDRALQMGTVVSMEANPPIYNTNYINTTPEALELCRQVASDGFRLNLDLGTMLHNGESCGVLKGCSSYVNHVHISEPGLEPIRPHRLHEELVQWLKDSHYEGALSIEMKKQPTPKPLLQAMDYLAAMAGEQTNDI